MKTAPSVKVYGLVLFGLLLAISVASTALMSKTDMFGFIKSVK